MREAAATNALGALAHEVRLSTFRLLVRAGPSGMASGDIADALKVQPTGMSFHLSALERAGLLASRREGRRIFYVVQPETMRQLIVFLSEECFDARPEPGDEPRP